jgi:hypothetical protein
MLSPSKPPIFRLSMYVDILSPPPRHPRQTAANYAFTSRCARRAAALNLILHITRPTWRVLGFLYRLRRPSRLRAASIAHALQLISLPPQPLLGYDLGFGDLTNDLVLRSPTGSFISHHPTITHLTIPAIPTYSTAGLAVAPLVPPASSRLVLCPESSGAWCYYHVDLGHSTWHLPPELASSSSPISPTALPSLTAFTADEQPPNLDPRLTLDNLERHTSWLPLYADHTHVITLYNKMTGCTRVAPWLTMRDHGRIYFVNIVSRESRWAPPLGWLDAWVSRVSPFDRRSMYARTLIPSSLARMHVEGGAPYMDSSGRPKYEFDSADTTDSYPM